MGVDVAILATGEEAAKQRAELAQGKLRSKRGELWI